MYSVKFGSRQGCLITDDFAPRRYLAMSGNRVHCHNWVGRCYWQSIEASYALQPKIHRTAFTTKYDLDQNVDRLRNPGQMYWAVEKLSKLLKRCLLVKKKNNNIYFFNFPNQGSIWSRKFESEPKHIWQHNAFGLRRHIKVCFVCFLTICEMGEEKLFILYSWPKEVSDCLSQVRPP